MKFTPPQSQKKASIHNRRILKPTVVISSTRKNNNDNNAPNMINRRMVKKTHMNMSYSFLKYTTVKINKDAFLKKRKAPITPPYNSISSQNPTKRRRKRSLNVVSCHDSNSSNILTHNNNVEIKPSAPPPPSMIVVHGKNRLPSLLNIFQISLDKEFKIFERKTNEAVNKISNRLSRVHRKYKYVINKNRKRTKSNDIINEPVVVARVVRRRYSR